MRRSILGLFGLLIATGSALADKRSGPSEAPRVPAKPVAISQVVKAPVLATRPLAIRRIAATRIASGAPAAACSPRRCRDGAVRRTGFAWSQGLPPALHVQANECPDGTLATLANGHEDVVRCMPI